MSAIEEMRERHAQEIKDLQDSCPHRVSTPWKRWYWAIGHIATTQRKWCERCGKQTGERGLKEV